MLRLKIDLNNIMREINEKTESGISRDSRQAEDTSIWRVEGWQVMADNVSYSSPGFEGEVPAYGIKKAFCTRKAVDSI